MQLKGGMPTIQVRDMTVQRRENDLVLATFGRGFYILDDYSALREITPQTLAEDARLFPLRDAPFFNQTGLAPAGTAGIGPLAGNWTAPNPPFGAVFTYSVREGAAGRREAGADDHRRNGQAGPPARPRQDGRACGAWRGTSAAIRRRPASGDGAAGRARRRAASVASAEGRCRRCAAGRYRATLGTLVGDKVTPIGAPQSFQVFVIPQ